MIAATRTVNAEVLALRKFQYDKMKAGLEGTQHWMTCSCGTVHPDVPGFKPSDGKSCLFYWQLAERFPRIPIQTIYFAESRFFWRDLNNSGSLDAEEFRNLIHELTNYSKSSVISTTFENLEYGNNLLDFTEVLIALNDIYHSVSPQDMNDQKSCNIQ